MNNSGFPFFKKFAVVVLFLLVANFGFGQTKEVDSLKRELLKPSLNDTTKIRLYINLVDEYIHISNDSVGKYSDLAMKLARSSSEYYLGRAKIIRGQFYSQDGQMDSARYYLKSAVEIGEVLKDTPLLAQAYDNYKGALSYLTDFEEKVRIGLLVVKLHEKNKFLLAQSQYNLSVTYSNGGFEDLAIEYLKSATKNAEESGHEKLLSYALFSLVYYALEENELEDAKLYLEKSLELCEKFKIPRICTNYYSRAGLYYDKVGQFDKAEIAYINALNGAKELNDTYDIMAAYVSLGKHFVSAKTPKKAIDNFEKFEEINISSPTPDLEVSAYENWAKATKMLGDYESSNKFLEKYIKIKDSLNSEKNKTSIANAETKYQSEKKDKEIAEQKLALTESKSKTRTMSILIVSLLLASILLWFLFQQRQKRIQQQLVTIQREHEVRTLESLMEGEEKERFRIAKELHDGVNGDLSAIKFKLSSLLEMNNTVIKEAVAMIDNSCEQVRAISHNLVPPSLKNFSLLEAVDEYCQSMNSIHDPEVHFQNVGDPIHLDKKKEANLFRIVQELVTNSIKHAEAKEINVQLSHLENTLQLTVEDNGKGFDPKTVKSDGIGMQNVQSRVDYLNATMDFVSNEKGTSYTIAIDTKNQTT